MEQFVSPVPRVAPVAHAKDVPTACCLCSHNCGLRLDVEDNKITAVRADEANPITHGYVCNKAFGIPHYVTHAQRVEHPMKRRPDGSFARVSWEEAIADIGARLAATRAAHGPRSIALVGVGGQGNHLDGPYALAWLLASGSPWWFNALAQEKTQHALVDGWLFDARSDVYLHADAEHTKFLLCMGTNPLVSNRGHNATDTFRGLKNDATRTLVVVDPRRTQTAKGASEHVAVRPGGDAFFLLGLAAVIVRERLEDREYLARFTTETDLAPIRAALQAIDPSDMARRAGVPVDQIVRVARGFANAESAAIFADLGVEQAPWSTLISYLMRVLLVLTGNLGRPGGSVWHNTFSPSAPRLDREPFRAPSSGIEAIAMLAPIGMFSPNLLAEEIVARREDHIRAVVVEGANPMIQAAGTHTLRAALETLDLLVVIDPAFTETSRLAHYVLPSPVGYEKWEYAGFPKRFPQIDAQVRPPVVAGPEDALPEAEIFARIARAAGVIPRAPRLLHVLGARATRSAAGAAAWFAAAGASALVRRGGTDPKLLFPRVAMWAYETVGPHLPAPQLTALWLISHLFALARRADLARTTPGTSRLPFVAGAKLFESLLAHPEGAEIARTDPERNLEDNLRTHDGQIRLSPPQLLAELRRAVSSPEAAAADYPLILNGGQRTHWNANTIQRDPAWRKGKGPHCGVSMNAADAKTYGVADGAMVTVTTRAGSVRLPAIVDDSVQPGNVLIPNGFGLEYPDPATGTLVRTGVAVNELSDARDRDPFTGCPHHKYIRCRVAPV
jgi:anaerobic selenocysteine-containing dehydrogenase